MSFESSDYEVLQERYADILKKLSYIECDVGWFDIIDKAFSDILKVSYESGVDVQIVQVKEKFAGLRIYFEIEDLAKNEDIYKQINDIIAEAEDDSFKTCEVCGEVGKVIKDKYWWKTYCISHQHSL